MKFRILILSFFSLIILFGCNTKKNVPLPDCGIPAEHMNQEITMIPDTVLNTYKIEDGVSTQVLLHENKLFNGPIDLNSEIYQYVGWARF